MVFNIPDHVLQEAGLTANEALVELACSLFNSQRLSLWSAAQLAGLSRTEFEGELLKRKIPIYRPSVDDFQQDLHTLRRLGL